MNPIILSTLGVALGVLAGLLMVMALGIFLIGSDPHFGPFLLAGILSAFTGGLLMFANQGSSRRTNRTDIVLMMLLIWLVLPAFAAMPLYLTGQFETEIRAYFEAMSGLTTTGATTSIKVENLSEPILVWRAILQAFGGALTLLTAVLVLAPFDPATSPTQSTVPGYEEGDFAKSVTQTAREVLPVFFSAMLAACLGLWASGLPVLDALVYGTSAITTSGFTTTNAGLTAFSSLGAETVACLAMLFGATSILAHRATLLRLPSGGHGDVRETWIMVALVSLCCALLVVSMMLQSQETTDAVRAGVFRAISLLTTTGLDNATLNADPVPFVITLALITMGGTAFSTAGGLKVFRMATMLAQAHRELKKLIHPRGISRAVAAGKTFDVQIMKAVWALFVVFVLAAGAIALVLGTQGETFERSIMAAVASLTNTGPALAMSLEDGVGPGSGYATMSSLSLLACALGMILGKLEFLAVLGLVGAWWGNRR